MGSTERRERQRQEMRRKILDAARELFVNEGPGSVTMRRIAGKIEYSATAIYTHFPSKEALIRDLCESDFFAFAADFMTVTDLTDPAQFLRETGRLYIRFALTHPSQFRLLFMTPIADRGTFADDPRKGNPLHDPYAYVRQAMEVAMQAGVIRQDLTDPSILAQTIWAGIHGVAALQVSVGGDPWIDWAPLETRIELMLEVLLRGIGRGES